MFANILHVVDTLKWYLLRIEIIATHLISIPEPKFFVCDECGYQTHVGSNMKRHKFKHTGMNRSNIVYYHVFNLILARLEELYKLCLCFLVEKPLNCELCDYKCIVARQMQMHMSTKHTDQRTYFEIYHWWHLFIKKVIIVFSPDGSCKLKNHFTFTYFFQLWRSPLFAHSVQWSSNCQLPWKFICCHIYHQVSWSRDKASIVLLFFMNFVDFVDAFDRFYFVQTILLEKIDPKPFSLENRC